MWEKKPGKNRRLYRYKLSMRIKKNQLTIPPSIELLLFHIILKWNIFSTTTIVFSILMSSEIQKSESGLRWIELHLNPPQPTSTYFNPLYSFYFFLMLMSSEIQKSESGLRWVEVDLNPPQSTL